VHVDIKVGILHTIADAIYSTPAGKIREAVANARDNGATWIAIVLDQTKKSLCLFDNGSGITEPRFHEIMEHIGYGLLQEDKEKKLSYFGLGLMSIFQLGKRVQVFTRPSKQKTVLTLQVQTNAIFDKSPENKKRSISSLADNIRLSRTDEASREGASVQLLNNWLRSRTFGLAGESFTDIVVTEISDEDIDAISSPGFLEELRKVLPLRVEPDEPFLKRLTGRKGPHVAHLLQDPVYCPTIDVYFGIQEQGAEVAQLWKYFPRFKSDLEFPDDTVYVGVSQDNAFGYYIVHSAGEDLYRENVAERENGFWIRNQNFLVKGADFLQKPGPGRLMIDQPLRNWIFGEILHRDMNRLITVARNDYLYDSSEFRTFRESVLGIVATLNKHMRDIWDRRSIIDRDFVAPFLKVTKPDGVFQSAERKLRMMIGPRLDDKDFQEQVLGQLARSRNRDIEDDGARVDVLLSRAKRPIVVTQDDKALVRVDPALTGKVETSKVTWDAKSNRVVVSVSPNLFEPKSIVFLGKEFKVVYVARKASDFGVSVNSDKHIVYINPFNDNLATYSVGVLDLYLALEVADAISKTKGEFKKNVLMVIGLASSTAAEYVVPLGDDLRRALSIKPSGA
jgi:hypothetical protein